MNEQKILGLTKEQWVEMLEDARKSTEEYKYIILYPGGMKSFLKERPDDRKLLQAGAVCYTVEEYFRMMRAATSKIPGDIQIFERAF